MERRFLRCTVRQALALVAVIGVLLAIVAPRMQPVYTERRQRVLNERLLAAAAARDVEQAAKAIAAGADPDAFDEKRRTPVGYAVQARDFDLLKVLWEAGANPNGGFGHEGTSPLRYAVEHDDLQLARHLLNIGADASELDLLPACVEHGQSVMLELLLSRGADANAEKVKRMAGFPSTGSLYGPALHLAIEGQHPPDLRLRMLRALLRNGADVHVRASGANAMDLAVRHSNAAVCDLLRQYGAEYTAREAVVYNRLDEVKQMVQENPPLLRERFPPFYAARPGQGPTLLGLALRQGHREMAMFLIDSGAPLDVLEWYTGTLMHQAAIGGDPELIKLLVDRGLDVNARDDYGDTPLHEAAWRGNKEAVAALIALGADVNARSETRSTALQRAAYYNHSQVVQLLLELGAETTLFDQAGHTAADIERTRGNDEVLRVLEQADAANP